MSKIILVLSLLLIGGEFMIPSEARAWSCNVGSPCVFAFRQQGVPGANLGGYFWGIPTFINDRIVTLTNISYLMPPALIPQGSAQWAIDGVTQPGILRFAHETTIDLQTDEGVVSWMAAAKKLP